MLSRKNPPADAISYVHHCDAAFMMQQRKNGEPKMSKGKIFIGLLIVSVVIGGIAFYKQLVGPTIPPQSAAQLERQVMQFNKVFLPPEGDGPYPVALMFHGCGGTHNATRLWAERFAKQGYATVVVDSLAPRSIDHETAMAEVCQGRLLRGDERSADILIALNWLQTQGWADADHVLLSGWSHGAWSILDALSRDLTNPDDLPISLTSLPTIDTGGNVSFDGVRGTILFYPYCGDFSRATKMGLNAQPKTLLLLAGEDSVVSMDECNSFASGQAAAGWDVSTQIFPGADHGFDVPSYDGENPNEKYSVQGSIQAVKLVRSFLADLNQ